MKYLYGGCVKGAILLRLPKYDRLEEPFTRRVETCVRIANQKHLVKPGTMGIKTYPGQTIDAIFSHSLLLLTVRALRFRGLHLLRTNERLRPQRYVYTFLSQLEHSSISDSFNILISLFYVLFPASLVLCYYSTKQERGPRI